MEKFEMYRFITVCINSLQGFKDSLQKCYEIKKIDTKKLLQYE